MFSISGLTSDFFYNACQIEIIRVGFKRKPPLTVSGGFKAKAGKFKPEP
jgi:hypothetical protein